MTAFPERFLAQMRSTKQPVFEVKHAPSCDADCANCGGMSYVYIFVAERGPYRDVPGGLKGDSVLRSVDDPMYGWVWYVGKTFGAECPTCKGIGRAAKPVSPVKQFNTGAPVKQLVGQLQK